MLIGLICYFLIDWILNVQTQFTFLRFTAQLAMIINFFPNPDHLIKPGPYWYFGLTLQLYILYRLIFYHRHWLIIVISMIACWIPQALCEPTSETLNWLRYNFIGSVLPFGLGILTGRHLRIPVMDSRILSPLYVSIAVISILALYSFRDNFQLWLWIPVIILAFSISIVKLSPECLLRPFEWVGGLSAMIFVIHPILRPVFLLISNAGWLYTGEILYFIATLLIAYLYKILMKYIPKPKLYLKR